ncbi:MAG: hypothetical protein ACRDK4_09915, partial [Solirubrobacteraceae bacterium]
MAPILAAMSLTAATLAPVSASAAPRQLRFACAEPDSGLLRYARHASDCGPRHEEAVVLAKQAPIAACVSSALTLAASKHGSHRIVIPSGTMWRAPSVPYCARLQQRGVLLGGQRPLRLCAARRGGLLRYISSAGACHAREIELLVAARPPRRKRPPHKPEKHPLPPEPTFAPVAESQSLSTPEGEPVSAVLAGHLVNTATGAVGGPVLSFIIA